MNIGEWTAPCESGHCVEVMRTETNVLVRNSRDADGPWLFFTHDEWSVFTLAVSRGKFDI